MLIRIFSAASSRRVSRSPADTESIEQLPYPEKTTQAEPKGLKSGPIRVDIYYGKVIRLFKKRTALGMMVFVPQDMVGVG